MNALARKAATIIAESASEDEGTASSDSNEIDDDNSEVASEEDGLVDAAEFLDEVSICPVIKMFHLAHQCLKLPKVVSRHAKHATTVSEESESHELDDVAPVRPTSQALHTDMYPSISALRKPSKRGRSPSSRKMSRCLSPMRRSVLRTHS